MNPYQLLFQQYVTELKAAHGVALQWWVGLHERETLLLGSQDEAAVSIARRWPFGPVSHPRVLAVYRKHFIACEALNFELDAREPLVQQEVTEQDWGVEESDAEQDDDLDDEARFWADMGPVLPPTFLFDFLRGRDDELAEFMTMLVFPAVGEEDGRSV